MTQNNLGSAYSDRIRGERGENLELAIACYQAALQVYTREAFPEKWARTQHNLGIAYRNRIRGERGENLELAIACFQAALQEYTPEALPLKCLQTGRNLGNLGFEQEDWENAIFGYDRAIRAVEQSRNWATYPQTKRQLLEDALPIYGKMVQACVTLERYEQALLTVERSKSRTLSEILSQADLIPKNATPAQQQRYRQLNREIAALQQSFQGDTALGDSPSNGEGRQGQTPTTAPPQQTPLQSLLQQRETLLAEIDDPDFQAIAITSPQLPDFSQLLTPTTAAIEWYLPQDTNLGAYAFIITLRDNRPHIQLHRYTLQQRQNLDNFNETYFSDYRQPSWYDRLSSRLDDLAQCLNLTQLLTLIPSTCNALILIPHLYLHLFPLQALSVTSEEEIKILQKCFAEGVRYAPSCQILAHLQNRRQRATASQFFAIQNPTQDLPYTEVEVETIRQPFDPNSYILKNKAANKAALNSPETLAQLSQSRFIHFSCHGGFDSENPLNSALVLAGDAPPTKGDRSTLTLRDGRRFDTEHQGLTLREIYANLELPSCVLVMLSACETGLLSSKLTDEYVGLASGFFYAGSASVVSSFWCVDDFATAFLAIRFYRQLGESPSPSIVVALQTAQNWLETVSKSDFFQWLSNDLKLPQNQIEEYEVRFHRRYKTDPPFAHPKYWAGFGAIGL
ncbi:MULTISPECIES: CHAT domain-containing tetratricopeptide repeat protein [Spirulina sp. CCY15215]|uniref:CHAT domain-containing protein n=1 Tax=Spirulina sp. CCY15215 TaxID=2767591 RepID=UPI0032AF9887